MKRERSALKFPLAGPRIRELRTGRGVSAETMGHVMGVAAATVSSIERGASNPSLYALIRAARYLDVPLTELAGENVEGLAS